MRQQGQTGSAQFGQCQSQIVLVDPGKAFDPGVNQEALEAGKSGCDKRKKTIDIAAHHPAPGSPIDPGFPLGGDTFGLQGWQIGGFRDAVQRHVHQHGHAARGRRLGRCRKAFPFGASRFIDVNVGVNQTGKQNEIAEIVQINAGRQIVPCAHVGNAPVPDQQGCRDDSLRRQNAS